MKKRVATMKDVAKLAGVSIASVSHVINKTRKVEDATREKVLQAIEQLHYKPNILAQSLKGKGSRTLGVIIADIREDYFSEVVKSIEFSALEKGYSVILCDSEDNLEMEKTYINVLLSKGVDGIILAPVNLEETYLNLMKISVPIVQIDRKFHHYRADFVGINNEHSAAVAVKYLLEKECRRIGFIGYNDKVFTQKMRKKGYREVLEKRGLFDESLIAEVDYHTESTMDKLKSYFSRNDDIDGVICGTSNVCHETVDTIAGLGLKIPGDIRVVSYDDSKWFDFLKYPISVIVQPTETIGRLAVDLVVDRIQERYADVYKDIVLDTDLLIRE